MNRKQKKLEDEYAEKMQEWVDYEDKEGAHEEADFLIVRFLKEAGFTKLADVYRKVGKWYG